MVFANLSLLQFLTLFGTVGGGVTLLYLLDRSRTHHVVPSLRFWTSALTPVETRRWRIREPWSLLLQLLGIALLLLAIAQPRIGGSGAAPRDHVLILDTSAWMNARWNSSTLMDEARAKALAYLEALPAADRVMVLRAGSIETPVTSFESKRPLLAEAIRLTEAGAGAVDLAQAIETAGRVRRLHARNPGEIVFVGSGRTAGETPSGSIGNLRFIQVGGAIDNVGLQRVGLRHSSGGAKLWAVYVAVRNHSAAARSAEVSVQFAGAPAAFKKLSLAPQSEQEFTFSLRTNAAGLIEVRVFADDDFPEDNYTSLRVPARQPLHVTVFTERPAALRPLLAASPLVETEFSRPGAAVGPATGLLVLDNCAGPSGWKGNTIWIQPPPGASPIPIVRRVADARIVHWNSTHPLGAGLHTRDLALGAASIFDPAPSDAVIAEINEGPVIVARGSPRSGDGALVVLGFHPARSAMRYELAAPLLFANLIRWMDPGLFREWELNSGGVGMVTIPLDEELAPGSVRVIDDGGRELPFSAGNGEVRFYTGRAGSVTVEAGDREIVYSARLPAVPDTIWVPSPGTLRGVPAGAGTPAAADIWGWLALAGLALLIFEWFWFASPRRRRSTTAVTPEEQLS